MATVSDLKTLPILRFVGGSLTRESDERLPRSLAEGSGITHDALAHAEIVATAEHNGVTDLTCQNYVVGAVFLNCHVGIISHSALIASLFLRYYAFFFML